MYGPTSLELTQMCSFFFFFLQLSNILLCIHTTISVSIHLSQYCVGFCHPSTWISHRYTHVPSLLNLPPTSLPIPPLDVVTEHWAELPGSHSKFPPAVYLTRGSGYALTLVSQLAPPSPSPAVSTVCSLRLHLHCCPANRNISTVFLDSTHLC